MPFIDKKEAFKILDEMMNGKCIGSCRKIWLPKIKNALKSNTNPLNLTKIEHKKMSAKIIEVKIKKKKVIDNKYLTRNSPPYPANKYCGKTKKGNDGKKYISIPDKNNICKWKVK